MTMLTIGEFSTVERLTVKALRIYHDAGILVPDKVDAINGYRYYGEKARARAAAVRTLRELDFTLKEMEEIFSLCKEEEDITAYLARKLEETDRELRRFGMVKEKLEILIEDRKEDRMANSDDILEKDLGEQLICSLRYKGRYDEIGTYFGRLFSAAGRYGARQPLALYYDGDYKENNADIEAAVTIRQSFAAPAGMACRVLPGGKAVVVMHRGPYETIGESYERLFSYCRGKGYRIQIPTREVYLKGPGMILKRNPKRFLTEVVGLVQSE